MKRAEISDDIISRYTLKEREIEREIKLGIMLMTEGCLRFHNKLPFFMISAVVMA